MSDDPSIRPTGPTQDLTVSPGTSLKNAGTGAEPNGGRMTADPSTAATLPPTGAVAVRASLAGARHEARGTSSESVSYSRLTPHASRLAGLGADALASLNDIADKLNHAGACNRTQREEIARGLGWSVSKLEKMMARFRRYGVAGLARKRRADRGRARVADQHVVAKIQANFLQPYRPPATHIYKDIARDYEMSGQKPPSYSFVLRTTRKIDPDLRAWARDGARTFDDKFALVTLRRKPALPRLWCDADHHIMDHIVIFADGSIGRPWLTAIQDLSTNEILGYLLSHEKKSTYPGSHAIGLTLRKAILKKDDPAWPSFGLFQNFYSDLGKDFRSQHVRAVCHDLNISVRYARGYHGKSKPIERWFGVLEASLRRLPGYVGNSTENNPLKQVLGAPRDWESMRGEIMTIEQFSAALHKWITAEFHHAESRALRGYSPLGLLEKHIKEGWSAREVSNERALDLLMMSRAGKTVQRMGVQLFSTLHTQRFYMAPELAGLVGQDVQVFWNPEKIGEVVVYKDDRFVCVARNRELLEFDATEEDVKAERELGKKQRDSVRERHQQMLMDAQYPNEMERVQAEKRLAAVESQEREKLAVGATAPAAAVILPKYHQAARQLKIKSEKLKSSESEFSRKGAKAQSFSNRETETRHLKPETNPYLEDDPLPTRESFRTERNPWLEEE